MTDYEWLTEMGLCHKCRKEKAAPNRKFCFDCIEKTRKENAKRYDPEKARAYQARRREIYREKKEKGVCVRCNKKATHGMYCYEHYIRARRRSMERANAAKIERHERGMIPQKRKENGLCFWCGEKAADGINACEKHRLIFAHAGRKAKESDEAVNDIWKLKKAKSSNCT